jgi:AcrR family transcriptional regulator
MASAVTEISARDRLIQAARNVFARYGYNGATTRRIATEAEVTEVTMFRLFGSKNGLLDEAVRVAVTEEHAVPLPEEPRNPRDELTQWCEAEIHRLRASRAVILQCLAEEAAHPDLAAAGASPLAASGEELNRYVSRLPVGAAVTAEERQAAATMLLAALHSDALGRQILPGIHPLPDRSASRLYVGLLLRALQVE